MPANLTPIYRKAEEAFRAAQSHEEKVAALEEMLRVVPKHKGTDHLQADLKRRLSKLRASPQPKSRKKTFDPYRVERGGAGQVPLVGPPNSGKSHLLTTLTRARSEVAPYPFTTQAPVPGMMAWEDVQVQLVDLPPIPGGDLPPGMLGLLKSVDGLVLVVDLADDDVLEQTDSLLNGLEEAKLCLYQPGAGQAEELPVGAGWRGVPVLMVGNKIDVDTAPENAAIVEELLADRFPLLRVSGITGSGLEQLRDAIYQMLDMVRVYGKSPGKPPDLGSPFVLPRGATVAEVATMVHRDFGDKLKTARVWGESAKFDGQTVTRQHVVADRDVLELQVAD